MSRQKIGVWIEKLSFFILFGGYYLGAITIAWAILPPDKDLVIQRFSHSEITCLVWSAMFGFALSLWGFSNAILNLKVAMQSRHETLIVHSIVSMVFCVGIALLPLLSIHYRSTIREVLNPPVWFGLVGFFLMMSACLYRRAQNTRNRLLRERLCAH